MKAMVILVGLAAAACDAGRPLRAPRFDRAPVRTYRGAVFQEQTVERDSEVLLREKLEITYADRVEIMPDGDGLRVTEELSDVAVSGRVSPEEDESTRRVLEGARFEVELGSDYKAVRATGPTANAQTMLALLQTEPQLLQLLPRAPMFPGQSWRYSDSIEIDESSITTSIRVTYAEEVPCRDARCARLATVKTITGSDGAVGGGTGTGIMLVSLDDGRLVSREESFEVDMTNGNHRMWIRQSNRLRRE